MARLGRFPIAGGVPVIGGLAVDGVQRGAIFLALYRKIDFMNSSIPAAGRIPDLATLEELFGKPVRSARQESEHLGAEFRAFVEQSPFIIVATNGADGLDASAKGDPGGFVKVLDEKTLLIPERGGNGRNDSLRNIVADPLVALTFFIPGMADLLRVNGQACLSIHPDLLLRFAKPPRCVIVVQVEEAFRQCSRAIQQSKLWSSANEE
jgi:PPOX class probable FMN-dependent enzyme